MPAGNDVEMGGGSYSFSQIPSLIKAGTLPMSTLDTAVSRLLRAKFEMGLFEKPYQAVPKDKTSQYVHTTEIVALARQLDAESIVLLENKEEVLPLKKSANIAG